MANVAIDSNTMTSIADAIRTASGTSGTFTPSQMSLAIENIPSGGGGSPYLVSSVAAMEALQNINNGDICIVYNESTENPGYTFATKKLIFPQTITFTTAISDNYEAYYYSRLVFAYININLDNTFGNIEYYYNDEENDIEITELVEYESSDGITYTRITNLSELEVHGSKYILENDNYYPATNLLQVVQPNFAGIYKYNSTEAEWQYLDIGTYANENEMVYYNDAYTSKGFVNGMLDIDDYKEKNIICGTSVPIEEPKYPNAVYLKLDSNIPQNDITYISHLSDIYITDVPPTGSNGKLDTAEEFSNNCIVSDSNYIYCLKDAAIIKYNKTSDAISIVCSIPESVNLMIINNAILKNGHIYFTGGSYISSNNYNLQFFDVDITNGTYIYFDVIQGVTEQETVSVLIDTIDDLYLYNSGNTYVYNSQTTAFDLTSISQDFLGSDVTYIYTIDKNNVLISNSSSLSSLYKVDLYNETKTKVECDLLAGFSSILYLGQEAGKYKFAIQSGYRLIMNFILSGNRMSYKGTVLYELENPQAEGTGSDNLTGLIGYSPSLRTLYTTEFCFPQGASGTGNFIFKIINLDFTLNMPQREGIFIYTGDNSVMMYVGMSIKISDIQVIMNTHPTYSNVVDAIYTWDGTQWNLLQ